MMPARARFSLTTEEVNSRPGELPTPIGVQRVAGSLRGILGVVCPQLGKQRLGCGPCQHERLVKPPVVVVVGGV
jgi:hypothetical protein